jgi:16S rRNA G966 N2-methylase RsmD
LTWKELKRFISDNNNNEEKEEEVKLQSERFRIFRDPPFWISKIEEHKKADIANNGKCCFNHIIGLPMKDAIDKPIFDYEMQLVNALDINKSVFVKKASQLSSSIYKIFWI